MSLFSLVGTLLKSLLFLFQYDNRSHKKLQLNVFVEPIFNTRHKKFSQVKKFSFPLWIIWKAWENLIYAYYKTYPENVLIIKSGCLTQKQIWNNESSKFRT